MSKLRFRHRLPSFFDVRRRVHFCICFRCAGHRHRRYSFAFLFRISRHTPLHDFLTPSSTIELFEPDKPRGATDPKQPPNDPSDQVGPHHRSLPARLRDDGASAGIGSSTGWTQLVDSPDPIPSTSDPPLPPVSQYQQTPDRPPRRPSTQLTTIYSTSGPQYTQHDPAAPSISIPTTRTDHHQISSSTHHHHPRHLPPQARRSTSLFVNPSQLDYFRHGDPRSPPPVLHTLPRPAMSSSRTIVPRSTEDRNDDSQDSSAAQTQPSSFATGTSVLSGGVNMGTGEYASIGESGASSTRFYLCHVGLLFAL